MKKKIILSIIFIILINLACGGISSPEPPTASGQGQVTSQTQSASNGEARFEDSINGNVLTITLKDDGTSEPIANQEVSFVSNGDSVLVIVQDPAGQYAPIVQEFRYAELSKQNTSGTKMAAPDKVIPFAVVLLLVKIVDLYQDFQEWYAFLQNFPRIENWGIEEGSFCVTPDQGKQALGLGADLTIGFIPFNIGKNEIGEALELLFEELVSEGTGDILDAYYGSQTPSIIRFTLFSINGVSPKFLRIDGFCLDPLDESSQRSALDWLLYGINHKDTYPFNILTAKENFFYANYLEGGDPVGREKFLVELEERFKSSNVACMGYSSNEYSIEVWTTDWSPVWEMNQLCYVGCGTLNPPHQSSTAGFFLSNVEGKWQLPVNYVNDPEKYYFGEHELISCDQPEKVGLENTESSSSDVISSSSSSDSCPGAPAQRLKVDEMAYVCTSSDSVKLREGPGRNYAEIRSLVPGADLKVIGGPTCANNWSWWEVETESGYRGWMSEGGDNIDPYFLCPK